jgi:hypothetical protein
VGAGDVDADLLDGRIDLDRIEWNAANLPLHFGIINCIHEGHSLALRSSFSGSGSSGSGAFSQQIADRELCIGLLAY